MDLSRRLLFQFLAKLASNAQAPSHRPRVLAGLWSGAIALATMFAFLFHVGIIPDMYTQFKLTLKLE